MIVADVMTRNPLCVHPEMSVAEARSLMKKEKIGRVPVLDKHNSLVGIVTEWDLVNACPSGATTLDMYEIHYLLAKLKVEEVMQRSVVSIPEDVVVEEAARIMVDNDISALPVMKGDALVGIVSDGDLFKLFINLFGAREVGARVTMILPERQGELHDITHAIAGIGGNIRSMVICDGPDVKSKKCIIKVADISVVDLENAVRPFVIDFTDVR